MHIKAYVYMQVGLSMPVSSTAAAAMKRACDEGRGELDFSSVYESQKKAKQ